MASRVLSPSAGLALDTSGYVQCSAPDQKPNETTGCWFWTDLDPSAQGYAGALLQDASATLNAERDQQGREKSRFDRDLGFSDLAPETVKMILRDCGRFKADGYGWADDDATDGHLFWGTRQAGEWADVGFPPLTVSLGDDGKVHLREARSNG